MEIFNLIFQGGSRDKKPNFPVWLNQFWLFVLYFKLIPPISDFPQLFALYATEPSSMKAQVQEKPKFIIKPVQSWKLLEIYEQFQYFIEIHIPLKNSENHTQTLNCTSANGLGNTLLRLNGNFYGYSSFIPGWVQRTVEISFDLSKTLNRAVSNSIFTLWRKNIERNFDDARRKGCHSQKICDFSIYSENI